MPRTEPPESTAPLNTLNSERGGDLGYVPELQAKADVRFVRAETVHRLGVGEAGKWFGEKLLLGKLLDYLRVEAFHEVEDLILGRVAHLEVELGVFGLPVAALVLVAQGAGNLEVAFEAGDHQELLELLGGLGQRVELARIQAGRDQVVAGSLRGRGGEEGGFDLHEAARVQVVAHVLHHAVAQEDPLPQSLPAEVEVAVLQAQRLVHGPVAFDLERRGLGGVQDLEARGLDLYRARREVGVLVALGTADDLARNGDRPLRPQVLCLGEDLSPFRVEGDLRNAPAVAQVYKDQTPVIPAPVHPAREPDVLPDVGLA